MAEPALRADVYRQVIDRAIDAIGIHRQGVMIHANAAMVALLEAESEGDLLGHSLVEYLHPDYRSMVDERLERLRQGKSNELVHEKLITLRGNVVDVEVASSPLEIDGEPGAAVVARDISDRITARQKLEQTERVAGLGRLAATVAHEFNNVLMAIQPYAEILRRKAGGDAAAEKPAVQILEAIKRGKAITTEILRFGRPAEVSLVAVNAGDWIRRVSERIRDMNLAGIEIAVVPPEEEAWVMADAAQLEQVVINVVTNARDSMRQGGTLTLRAGCRESARFLPAGGADDLFCICVTDTGEGIPPEVQARIFEPLFTTKPRGTGLGLAVAQQIMARHGGSIGVQSEPGKGSTFYLLLHKASKPADR